MLKENTPYDAADELRVTREASRFWGLAASGLVAGFERLEEAHGRTAALIALNGITATRMLEIPVATSFVDAVQDGKRLKAVGFWATKHLLTATDGVDGRIARERNLVTKIGGIADPVMDAVSIFTDIAIVEKLADPDDELVRGLLTFHKIGYGAIIVAATANTLATSHARRAGAVITKKDEVISNAHGKLKHGLIKVGFAFLQASYIDPSARISKSLRNVGIAFIAGAQYSNVLAPIKYAQECWRKIKLAKQSRAK